MFPAISFQVGARVRPVPTRPVLQRFPEVDPTASRSFCEDRQSDRSRPCSQTFPCDRPFAAHAAISIARFVIDTDRLWPYHDRPALAAMLPAFPDTKTY